MELIVTLDTAKEFAKVLAKVIKPNDVICLNGNLGTGKTTFTQFFAAALGIKEIVNSPTFNIIKCYFNEPLNLYHIDAYRLEGNTFDIGLDEYIYGEGVCVIEWAEFIKDYIPNNALNINIERIDENTRKYSLSGNENIIKEVKKLWEMH